MKSLAPKDLFLQGFWKINRTINLHVHFFTTVAMHEILRVPTFSLFRKKAHICNEKCLFDNELRLPTYTLRLAKEYSKKAESRAEAGRCLMFGS